MTDIENLKEEIKIAQLDDFLVSIEKNTEQLEKEIRKDRIKAIKIAIPYILSMVAYLFCPDLLTKFILMTILSGYATTKVILNIDKEDEFLNKKRFLIKPIGKIYKEKDFYSWKYAKIVRNGLWRNKYIETEDDRKYKIALEKQKRQNMIKKNKIVAIEETLETFTTQGNAFTFAYNLPPINISDKEWDAFLNTVYEEFKRNNLTEKFQEYILHVFRITCAKAIVHGDNSITIHDLIDNLSFLQSYKEYLNEEKRVNSIKDNILFNLNNDIITFTKNPDNIIAEFAPNNENNQSISKSENKVISLKKVAKSKK